MLQKTLPPSIIALVLVGAASADPTKNFCVSEVNCKTATIANEAKVNMKNVTVVQQTTDGACTKDKRKYKGPLRSYQSFDISVNPTCKYTIKFNAGTSCAGDKTAFLTAKKFEEGRLNVQIYGGCGSLNTDVTK